MSAVDPFAEKPSQLDSPARHAAIVVPDDENDLPVHCRALLVGTEGAIKVTTVGGETLTLPVVPVGVLQLGIARVWEEDLTADNLVALW